MTGSGYTAPPLVYLSGGGSLANGVATINASGQLTGVTITNPGYGYASAPALQLLGGGGTLSNYSVTLGTLASGGLTFQGSGATTLSNINTYTGPTTLGGGTLTIGGTGNLGYPLAGGGAYPGNISIASSSVLNYSSSSNQTFSGTISGGGRLVDNGAGGLTLSGSNTYTGLTVVNSGALTLASASLSSTAVNVGANGILSVPGNSSISGSVSVAGGGTINLQSGSLNTLTLGNLYLASNANLNFDVGSTPGSCDKIAVTGKATIFPDGTATIDVNLSMPVLSSGTYTLMTAGAGSTLWDNTFNVIPTNPPFHGSWNLNNDTTATALILSVSANPYPGTAYWTGNAGSN